MNKEEEQPQEDSPLERALQRLREEQRWYERERELLEGMERDHQLRWKLFMRRVGRL